MTQAWQQRVKHTFLTLRFGDTVICNTWQPTGERNHRSTRWQKRQVKTPHLADTMTASRSLHRSAGMDFRHCLDRRKSPGKKTEPAARMDSMIPGDPSKRRKVLWQSRDQSEKEKHSQMSMSEEALPIDLHGGASHPYISDCTYR